MRGFRLNFAVWMIVWSLAGASAVAAQGMSAREAVLTWYKLSLQLVRHTPTYSPPVASRAMAYMGVAAYEAVASGSPTLISLAGQLNELTPVPMRETNAVYDDAVVVQAALAAVVAELFANTGPTGQRAMAAIEKKLHGATSAGIAADVVSRSETYGKAVAAHVLAWARDDGGAVVENMGFPLTYDVSKNPGHWTPTSRVAQQQVPLLPDWGKVRTFAMPDGATCGLPPPPAYSEDKNSQFYREAFEVYKTVKELTPQQRATAAFWSDDPMLSPTPPGHWVSVAIDILGRDEVEIDKSVETLARLGIGLADAFIGCWDAKFEYDLVRPLTYIRRFIDPKWETVLNTPPFPEYPSGHSTQSGAAATVLTQIFGANFVFEDSTHVRDGLKPRRFTGFWAAAEEAGISRLYGGIHFRSAIERGLDQGRCIGAYANALRMGR